jgi:hypothetical protein
MWYIARMWYRIINLQLIQCYPNLKLYSQRSTPKYNHSWPSVNQNLLALNVNSVSKLNGVIMEHGFMPGKSCASNLAVFLDKVTKAVDDGKVLTFSI